MAGPVRFTAAFTKNSQYNELSRLFGYAASPTRDWQVLGEELGYNYNELLYFKSQTDPTSALFKSWKDQEDATCERLIAALSRMDHYEGIQFVKGCMAEKARRAEPNRKYPSDSNDRMK